VPDVGDLECIQNQEVKRDLSQEHSNIREANRVKRKQITFKVLKMTFLFD